MMIYCFKCHTILQRTGQNKVEHGRESFYECPRCKYTIVVWVKL